jgi:hypothetical protein
MKSRCCDFLAVGLGEIISTQARKKFLILRTICLRKSSRFVKAKGRSARKPWDWVAASRNLAIWAGNLPELLWTED